MLRTPLARTAAVMWPLAGRAQGGAGLRVRLGLVGLGRFSAGGAAVRRPLRSRVRGFRAGGGAAIVAAGRSRCVARSGRVGAGGVDGWGFLLVFRGGVAAAADRRGAPARVISALGGIKNPAGAGLEPLRGFGDVPQVSRFVF